MQELSTQSRKIEFDRSYAQRVFKCRVSLAYAESLSSKPKNRVWLPPCTASLQVSYLVDMCGGSLLKDERPSPITPKYNESSSVMSRWHMQRLSPQNLKTKSDCHRAQRVFKHHTSLTCVGVLFSKSKDRVRSTPRTMNHQVSCLAGIHGALSSKSKDRVRSPPRTASLQALYLVDMCGGSLFKVERPSPITLTYN